MLLYRSRIVMSSWHHSPRKFLNEAADVRPESDPIDLHTGKDESISPTFSILISGAINQGSETLLSDTMTRIRDAG